MEAHETPPVHEGRRRLSVAHLLTALVAMFVILPFAGRVAYGDVVETAVFTLVLLAAVNAVGGQRRTLVTAALLVTPALVTRWLSHLWPDLRLLDLSLVAATIFVAFIIAHLFRFVLSARLVSAEVLCAAISIYLLFAVAWSFLYTLLARFDPGAFAFTVAAEAGSKMAGFTALHFSMETLTAIAYGDILPVSNVARMMATVEVTTGIFYVTILIARLVGLYSSGPPSGSAQK